MLQQGPIVFVLFCFKGESTEKLSPFCTLGNKSTENEPRPPHQSRAGRGLEGVWTQMGHLTSSQQDQGCLHRENGGSFK